MKLSIYTLFTISIFLLCSASTCNEEGVWLSYNEAEKNNYIASANLETTPVKNIREYLATKGAKAKKIRITSTSGKCACSKRKNGNCLCKLPNNKRYGCADKEELCSREKLVRVFVELEFVDAVKSLGFAEE